MFSRVALCACLLTVALLGLTAPIAATASSRPASAVPTAADAHHALATKRKKKKKKSSKQQLKTQNIPASYLPSKVLNLQNWKVTLPYGSSEKPTEILQPTLASYSDARYFYASPDLTSVTFRAPVNGVTTKGSNYPRSELREMSSDGSKLASWSNSKGEHVMTLREAITATPKAKPEVVAAQIHDSEDDVIMVRLEKSRLFVEANGKDVGALNENYVLGTPYNLEIRANSTGIRVTYDNTRVVAYKKVGKGYYFKAGCYTQSNTSKGDVPDAYGEVVLYSLSVQHS